MPEMDGWETIARLRQLDPASKPIILMVTTHGREMLVQRSVQEQASLHAFLVKPITASMLFDAVADARAGRGNLRTKPRAADSDKRLQGMRLLVVEDNPVNQELALEILQDAGLRVDVANNGLEAVEKVGSAAYDGVLMDCQMPVMDGFEAARKIRQDGRFTGLPILAMTANAMAGDKERCIECGMNDHITKPIDVAHLFLTLAQWIKPRQNGMVNAGLTPVEALNLSLIHI